MIPFDRKREAYDENISSFRKKKKILLLTPKLDVLDNIFTCVLTTLRSRSHYFIDVGNEDQKSQVF